mgnify:CR=1 FL=1
MAGFEEAITVKVLRDVSRVVVGKNAFLEKGRFAQQLIVFLDVSADLLAESGVSQEFDHFGVEDVAIDHITKRSVFSSSTSSLILPSAR